MNSSSKKKRIVLKLSGESLANESSSGIDVAACNRFASSIARIVQSGIEVAVVIGGGNLCRGKTLKELGIGRSSADQVGMLATIMNGLTLQSAISNHNVKAKVFSALFCPQVAAQFNLAEVEKALTEGEAVIFVGGTGNPFFTTDSAAALRAVEIGADLLVKATKVNGVYDSDPKTNADAKFYSKLTYTQALNENLKVMDATALALCRENQLPILVMNMSQLDSPEIDQIILNQTTGTFLTGE